MKKFLNIYNDADDMYVLCNVSDIKFVTVSVLNPTTETQLFYNSPSLGVDQIIITHAVDSLGLNRNAIVAAIKEVSRKGYTKSFIEVKLPIAVTQITNG
jgi:hypothetical protein